MRVVDAGIDHRHDHPFAARAVGRPDLVGVDLRDAVVRHRMHDAVDVQRGDVAQAGDALHVGARHGHAHAGEEALEFAVDARRRAEITRQLREPIVERLHRRGALLRIRRGVQALAREERAVAQLDDQIDRVALVRQLEGRGAAVVHADHDLRGADREGQREENESSKQRPVHDRLRRYAMSLPHVAAA